MAIRRHHYDLAFEHLLRRRRMPYICVDEAKRSLPWDGSLKNFDFLVHPKSGQTLIIDVKGRSSQSQRHPKTSDKTRSTTKISIDQKMQWRFNATHQYRHLRHQRQQHTATALHHARPTPKPPAGNGAWVGAEDLDALSRWQQWFGPQSMACFAFLFWLPNQPADGLYQDVFVFRERWYALYLIHLDDYLRHRIRRNRAWDTWRIPLSALSRHAMPLSLWECEPIPNR